MTISDIQDKQPQEKIYAAFGEIMLRLSSPGFERLLQSPALDAVFGGGESNVLASLACHGLKTRFISALPDNAIGKAALHQLSSVGIDVSKVILKKSGRMGIYYLEKGACQRPSKVVYDRSDAAINHISGSNLDWKNVLDDCGWFHITGITPALSKNAADETLKALRMAREMGLVVSCDLNFRAKLWKYGVAAQEFMPEMAHNADVIIANEEDIQKSLGIGTNLDPSSGRIEEERYADLSAQVMQNYPRVKLVAITLRQSISASHNVWGSCLYDGREFMISRTYDITHIVDRVGAGDSFAAGLIYALSTMNSLKDALEYATAASCLKHLIEGDWNMSTKEEIMNLMQGDMSGRIKR